MKPITEKIQYKEASTVYAATHTTPFFEYPLHQHIEIELILCKKASGTLYIGNHIESYTAGDIFLIGSNVPHYFIKSKNKKSATAVVVQFNTGLLGDTFNNLNECKPINNLFKKATLGIKINNDDNKKIIKKLIGRILAEKGLKRLIHLLECLDYIAKIKNQPTLTSELLISINNNNPSRIETVYEYTIMYLQNKITLNEIASVVHMSVPAFCKFFKQSTRKTYIQYLNEIRIDKACNLLLDTEMTINEIAYHCGYNTQANFHRQFFKIKNMQPNVFRKQFLNRG